MDIREFVKSKLFIRNLLYAVALAIVIIWVSMKLLDVYTQHGRTVTVPELRGLFEPEVKRTLRDLHLRYVINDSIFNEDAVKGSMFAQDPPPGNEVKKGRTIYLTMVALMHEMVSMPNLTDLSHRQAVTMLNAYGLRPGKLEYRPDIAQNAVLQQKFNNGPIEPGTPVAKGTAIDLVLGQGLGTNIVMVPVLLGKTRDEAVEALHAVTLNVGNEFYPDDRAIPGVRVYQQHPNPLARREYLQAGSSVDLYYRSPDVFDFDTFLAEQLTVPVPMLFGKTPEEVRLALEEAGLTIGEEKYDRAVSPANARAYRQEPEYEEDVLIQKGSPVNIWYRSVEAFEQELLDN